MSLITSFETLATRTVSAIVQALVLAKEAGIGPNEALNLVNWEDQSDSP